MAKKKAKNRFFGLTSRVLMMIVAGLLVLSYLSVVVNPAKVWLISLVGIFFIPLSIVNVLLFLWAIKRRSKSFVIPLLALLPSLFFVGRYVQVDTESEKAERSSYKGEHLKVISYNVGRFAVGDDGFEACADSIFTFIMEQNPDIVCLQEFHISDADKVKAYLRKKMPGYRSEYYLFPTDKGAFGNVTLSRLPIEGKGVIKFDGSANLSIYTDYRSGSRHFRVYNCHFESYNISISGILRSLSGNAGEILTETGTKMKKSITRRPKQVDQVFSHIESCPVDAFVCGDFNDNPMSYTYYRMTRDRKDAFVEAGHGFGATYAPMWPMLRIDYILYPQEYDAADYDIPRLHLSDHYPVVTEIVI